MAKVYVLITDPQVRKSFDIYNVVRKQYPQYRTLVAENRQGLGRKVSRFFTHGGTATVLLREDHWAADLADWLTKHPEDTLVYFPIEESTTLRFYDFLKEHSFSNLKFALPEEETFHLVRDKHAFTAYCAEHQLPAPALIEDLQLLKDHFVPVVAKPRVGSGSLGLRLIHSPQQIAELESIDWSEYVVQEMLDTPKDVKGAFFLMDKGHVVGYYGHQRIRTYPPEGGVTVFSRLDMNEALREAGEKILGRLKWNGLAMIEYLPQKGSGAFKAIEINPRAWGSILLSEVAGQRFIGNYLRLALGDAPEPVVPKSNAFIRWVFPYDFILLATRKMSFGEFFRRPQPTTYINFSYTSFGRGLAFILASIFNVSNLKKLWRKIRQ